MDGQTEKVLFYKCHKPNLNYLGLRDRCNGSHSHPSERVRSLGNEEWDSSVISLFPSCFHVSFLVSLSRFLHADEGVETSGSVITYFFHPSLSVLHPTPVWETPREHLDWLNFGHIFMPWTMCMVRRVRGYD